MNAREPGFCFPIAVTVRADHSRVIAKGIRELASALGKSVGKVHALLEAGVLPPKGDDGYDVEAARRALDPKPPERPAQAIAAPSAPSPPSSMAPEAPLAPRQAAAPSANALIARAEARSDNEAAAAAELEEADQDLLDTLGSSGDPVELAKAAGQLAARRFAREVSGGRTGRGAEELKRSLEEWRRSETAAIELGRERGTLIERDLAKSLTAEVVRRAVDALERLEAQLPTTVQSWLGDPAFVALPPADQARAVRAWAREQSDAVRSLTADELDRLIELEEKGAGA